MQQKFFIFIALIVLVTILIGLNAATYVQKEKKPDSELRPNRSTFNIGATGTRALYDLLAETNHRVTRWREPVSKLGSFDENVVSTFVVIGRTRREFTDEEMKQLLDWVSSGGRLVVIDRDPPTELISTTANYSIDVSGGENSMPEIEKETLLYSVDPADQNQMTAETKAARSTQPTVFTSAVNGVQPSKFASTIDIKRLIVDDEDIETGDTGSEIPIIEAQEDPLAGNSNGEELNEETTRDPSENAESNSASENGSGTGTGETDEAQPSADLVDHSMTAPVIHLANDKKTLLADFPFGAGQVVFLTDPYIVANGGIRIADNVQLAANVLGARRGVIAFDEFHQGYSNNENQILAYFSGTPVSAIFLQVITIIGLVMFSRSRRFARPLPPNEPNRLSKLEYISAMAQLQQRTKAYDLAMENIYSDFRRRVSRMVGVDNRSTSREALAKLIAERSKFGEKEIGELLFKCEDISHGEPTNKREILKLAGKIREIEAAPGFKTQTEKTIIVMTNLELTLIIVLFFITSVIGVVTGSNSLVTVPVMFQFGIDPKVAIATNMFGLAFMNVGASIPFMRAGVINYKRMSPLVVITLVASALGALLVGIISTEIIPVIVSVSMICVAVFILVKRDTPRDQKNEVSDKAKILTFVLTFLLGIYGGLYSGGYVTVLTAVFAAFFGMTFTEAIAGTKFINVFSSGIATVIFAAQGLIDYKLGIILAVTMFIAAFFGAHFVTKMNDLWLKRIFLATVFLLAVKHAAP